MKQRVKLKTTKKKIAFENVMQNLVSILKIQQNKILFQRKAHNFCLMFNT